ncbi:small GTP-binding protein [Histomonas meleagridis]|uniref:small GTP-binding protein n=1 Tax=Histomonas meleagridis TaxID=135588 RepID=UPI00355A5CEC|nr:small GTP-binding protein [Histomonas meleagridis]KAH0803175.1 small GTP-binding protein [Histomonas meleagridis]
MQSDLLDVPYRVVTIGEESVGKTSITNRLVGESFNQNEPSTVGANYQQIEQEKDGNKICIQIWDTAGQERFKSLAPIYLRNACAALVVFSLTSKSSFESLGLWIEMFYEIAGQNTILCVIANKSDLTDEHELTLSEANDWAAQFGYPLFEVSAKTGYGIDKVLDFLLTKLPTLKEGNKSKSKKLTQSQEGGQCC